VRWPVVGACGRMRCAGAFPDRCMVGMTLQGRKSAERCGEVQLGTQQSVAVYVRHTCIGLHGTGVGTSCCMVHKLKLL
jgi:hypothetical protein